jgi:hypothetical protein
LIAAAACQRYDYKNYYASFKTSQRMNRYTVYCRSSSAMAALRLLPRIMAISRKPRLALTLEEQR